MPAVPALITAGAMITSTALGARSAGKGVDAQLKFEREREAKAQEQWEAEQARRAPFREMADAIMRRRAADMGIAITPRERPASMPPGWQPGQDAPQPSRPQSTIGDIARRDPGLAPTAALEAPRVDPQPMTIGALAQRRRY